jgi:hypothetical protein
MRSGTWTILAIALLGLVLAVALGIFADTIARGTVALPSTNLASSDAQLAPEQAVTRQVTTTPPKKAEKRPAATGTTTAEAGASLAVGRVVLAAGTARSLVSRAVQAGPAVPARRCPP